jgi:cell shape-determining protein MreD
MRPARFLIVLLLAYLAVFVQAGFDVPRVWLNGQINLVPPLMVYTALRLNLTCVTALAVLAGLWLDSLSANPLGASILPLFLTGFLLLPQREVLLQELDYAQLVLGAAASAAVPILTLILVLTKGLDPGIGWHSLWQLAVLTITGGVLTPALFRLLDRIEKALLHPTAPTLMFRPDRDMRRGRY